MAYGNNNKFNNTNKKPRVYNHMDDYAYKLSARKLDNAKQPPSLSFSCDGGKYSIWMNPGNGDKSIGITGITPLEFNTMLEMVRMVAKEPNPSSYNWSKEKTSQATKEKYVEATLYISKDKDGLVGIAMTSSKSQTRVRFGFQPNYLVKINQDTSDTPAQRNYTPLPTQMASRLTALAWVETMRTATVATLVPFAIEKVSGGAKPSNDSGSNNSNSNNNSNNNNSNNNGGEPDMGYEDCF